MAISGLMDAGDSCQVRRGEDSVARRSGLPLEQGRVLDPSQADRSVAAAAKRAKIKGNVSAYWLHHAHASHALDRGAPPHLMQSTLGHASLSTTSRYLHARPGDSSARYLAI
jgi:site-specific recombinase XerD